METSTLITLSATISFLFLCVGVVVGWIAKDFTHDYMWSRDEVQYAHPECYNSDGQWINEELLTVKFIEHGDELDETDDE